MPGSHWPTPAVLFLWTILNEGKYGSLHDYFYSTVGTGTTQGEARRMAKEIIPLLKEDHVDAVIMVST